MTRRLPLVDLKAQRGALGDRVEVAIQRVLDHGQFVMGPEVAELEEQLAAYCGVQHAVTCASGTDALLLPLLAWGVGPGDGVFVPGFTFAATAEVVALTGATPVFVDVDALTFNLSPRSLSAAVDWIGTTSLRPVGVIPVDLFGQPAEHESIAAIARTAGMWILADGAQSFGARIGAHRVGRFGQATTTSFFPSKPLGCYGDGGAVFTNDEQLADEMRSLRAHGQGHDKYETVRVGVNSRLDTMQAAILLAKLAILDDELAARGWVATRYSNGLREVGRVPVVQEGMTSSWAQYTMLLNDRDSMASKLRSQGISTAIYYPKPLREQVAYIACPVAPDGLPNARHLARHVLSIPMHPYLSQSDQDRVIEAMAMATLV